MRGRRPRTFYFTGKKLSGKKGVYLIVKCAKYDAQKIQLKIVKWSPYLTFNSKGDPISIFNLINWAVFGIFNPNIRTNLQNIMFGRA